MNAADDEKRAAAIETLRTRFEERRAAGAEPYVRVLMHSLAFGSLAPFIADDRTKEASRKQFEMTLDVMANSLVYWVRDCYHAGLLQAGSRVFAMTSGGLGPGHPDLRRRQRRQGGPRVPRPPAGHGARPAGGRGSP
jgi:enoyl-[acyl-carrier protein] reductase III